MLGTVCDPERKTPLDAVELAMLQPPNRKIPLLLAWYSAHVQRVVAYVEEQEYQKLKVALVLDELSFSAWLRQQMDRYVQSRLRGTLTLLPVSEEPWP